MLLPRSQGGGDPTTPTPVPGEGYSWWFEPIVVTAVHVAQKYFDLPSSAPDIAAGMAGKVFLGVETSVQFVTEYVAVGDDSGKLRRISWAGKGLEADPPMQSGWRVWVAYPVPIVNSTAGYQFYRGAFATQAALIYAHPTDVPGAYAVVFETNTVWIWNEDRWVNTGVDASDVGIGEAPVDDRIYGRKNKAWVEIGGLENRPYRPLGVSPSNGATDIGVLLRLHLSAYEHPYAVPIAGSHWQIAADAEFTDIAFEQIQWSASSSVVVSKDADAQPYLSPETIYFWRGKYIDVRMAESDWCDTIQFTTAVTPEENAILQPEILSPPNEGYIQETGLVVQLAPPIVIGSLSPDKIDLQIGSNSDFANPEHVYANYEHSTLLLDPNASFVNNPSPMYMRARQKDSVLSIESPWSAVPTVWIQKYYSGIIAGLRTIVNGNVNVSQHIDENGKVVNIHPEYWDTHPVWGGMVEQKYRTPLEPDIEQDVVRLPSFHVNARTKVGGDTTIHEMWIGRDPFHEGESYLHPAFVISPFGLLISGAVLTQVSGKLRSLYDVNRYTSNVAILKSSIAALNGLDGSKPVRPYNIHVNCALSVLARIEKGTWNTYGIDASGSGCGNTTASMTYRGIRGMWRWATTMYMEGFRNIHYAGKDPYVFDFHLSSPLNPSTLIPFGTCSKDEDSYTVVSATREIFTGWSDVLQAHAELYLIPKVIGDGSKWSTRYYMQHNNLQNSTNDYTEFMAQDYTFTQYTNGPGLIVLQNSGNASVARYIVTHN